MDIPQATEPYSLKAHNSLGLEAFANRCIRLSNSASLYGLSQQLTESPRCILGHGTNLVIQGTAANPLKATVILNELKGIVRLPEQADGRPRIRCAAGESWHAFVMWTLAQGYGGLENLALIPGTVGAAPVQNIGAYGVEVADQIDAVHAWDFHQRDHVVFENADCAFGYRHSLFKDSNVQGPWNAPRYLITAVDFRLWSGSKAPLRLAYAGIEARLTALGIDHAPNPYQVAHAVMSLRREKLPDPEQEPNVGSFFKNPVVPKPFAQSLTTKYPNLPCYEAGDQSKLSAAWLIEAAGLKGWGLDQAGMSGRHALVLINRGQAKAADVLADCQGVQKKVMGQFGVWLEPEPLFWPGSQAPANDSEPQS
ncbi:MAG: UDP-N-acetylmuramate dehydrogenase [Burkholderiaceae bacterium]